MRLAALSACGAGYAPGVRDTRSPAHPQPPLDPPAPRVIPLLRTSDVDEARLVFNQLYGEASTAKVPVSLPNSDVMLTAGPLPVSWMVVPAGSEQVA